MSKIVELFGIQCDSGDDVSLALKRQICPFTGKRCFKTRKSRPDVAIGTCTVRYQGTDVIICPNRLLERNKVFVNCIHLLSLHEPGNDLYIVPEVSIPGGSVDYVLVSAQRGKVKDFVGIEFQTMDTTGTVWPERQRFLQEKGYKVLAKDVKSDRPYGMNWKMTAKTILMQLNHKTITFENLNKHLVLVIQSPLMKYMRKEFSFEHVEGVRIGDAMHIHSYDFQLSGHSVTLGMENRVSTDASGVAKCLGLQAEARLGLEDVCRLLEGKLKEEYRLVLG